MMCEFCEGDIVTPIYERKDRSEYCSVDIVYDSDGFYLNFHHDSNGWDAVTMDIYPSINYCPMCGRKLAERGQ